MNLRLLFLDAFKLLICFKVELLLLSELNKKILRVFKLMFVVLISFLKVSASWPDILLASVPLMPKIWN